MSAMWECPDCRRRFGRARQGHECAPAMDLDEYFASGGPDGERAVFESVLAHLQTLDRDVWFEPVSVGIFFKRRSTFLSLRTMTKWVALGFSLDRELQSARLSRKVIAHGGRYHHVVNIRDAAEIDEEILEWLSEAWEADAGRDG